MLGRVHRGTDPRRREQRVLGVPLETQRITIWVWLPRARSLHPGCVSVCARDGRTQVRTHAQKERDRTRGRQLLVGEGRASVRGSGGGAVCSRTAHSCSPSLSPVLQCAHQLRVVGG